MQNHYDAIIIGAGIIGTAIARALAQRGWRILGIDQLAGAGQGSTGGSAAMVRTQYSTRESTALAWEGYHCWSDWPGFLAVDDQADIAPFHPAGVLTFKTADNGFLEKPLAFSLELGIPFEQWPVEKPGQRSSPVGTCALSGQPCSGATHVSVKSAVSQ